MKLKEESVFLLKRIYEKHPRKWLFCILHGRDDWPALVKEGLIVVDEERERATLTSAGENLAKLISIVGDEIYDHTNYF